MNSKGMYEFGVAKTAGDQIQALSSEETRSLRSLLAELEQDPLSVGAKVAVDALPGVIGGRGPVYYFARRDLAVYYTLREKRLTILTVARRPDLSSTQSFVTDEDRIRSIISYLKQALPDYAISDEPDAREWFDRSIFKIYVAKELHSVTVEVSLEFLRFLSIDEIRTRLEMEQLSKHIVGALQSPGTSTIRITEQGTVT